MDYNEREAHFQDRLSVATTIESLELLRAELSFDMESIRTRLSEIPFSEEASSSQKDWRLRATDALLHKIRQMRIVKIKLNTIRRRIRSQETESEAFFRSAQSLYAAIRVMRFEIKASPVSALQLYLCFHRIFPGLQESLS